MNPPALLPPSVASCTNVSSINSFVSTGTGGSKLSALGVEACGVSLPSAATGSFSPSAANGVSMRCWLAEAGVPGRELGCTGLKVWIGSEGAGCCGVSRSMRYDRNSSNCGLRCGRRVEKRVDVVRREEASKAGESDRVSWTSIYAPMRSSLQAHLEQVPATLIPHALLQFRPLAQARAADLQRRVEDSEGR